MGIEGNAAIIGKSSESKQDFMVTKLAKGGGGAEKQVKVAQTNPAHSFT